MPNTRLLQSALGGRRRAGLRCRLTALALLALLLAAGASVVLAARGLVEKVEATTGADTLRVEVTTSAPATPDFAVFPLREPDRLVVDLPEFVWKPGLTAHLPSANAAVQQIRVGQFSPEPPVTRIVFDLTPPARPLRYRAVSSTASGSLELELSPQPQDAGDDRGGWRVVPGKAAPPPAGAGRAQAHAAEAPAPAAEPRAVAAVVAPVASADALAEPAVKPVARPAVRQSPQPQRDPWSLHAVRVAAALALLVFTGLAAVWARRRLQRVSGRPHPLEADPHPAAVAAQSTTPSADGDKGDLVNCRVVDGYLVLAPEGGASALPSAPQESRRVRVEQGTLQLDFSGANLPPSPLSDDAGPDAATRAADLIASLSDDSIAVRRAAEEGLLELASSGGSAELARYLHSDDPKVRSLAAGILGEAAAIGSLPEIARLVDDPDPLVRRCVMYAFARFGEAAADRVSLVQRLLADADSSVRAGAIEALAALLPRSRQAAEEIARLTGHDEPIVRQAAAAASFAYALRGVADPLIGLLADFSRRPQALELLQQADDVVLWRLHLAARSSTEPGAQAALDTLSYVMSTRWSADDFREEIESPDSEARLTGLEALSMIGGPEAARLVRRVAQQDPLPEVRARAEAILAHWREQSETASVRAPEDARAAS
ncbi:MAG: HEAT repeat domain-containing protein [Armatimonadota bacterium]